MNQSKEMHAEDELKAQGIHDDEEQKLLSDLRLKVGGGDDCLNGYAISDRVYGNIYSYVCLVVCSLYRWIKVYPLHPGLLGESIFCCLWE